MSSGRSERICRSRDGSPRGRAEARHFRKTDSRHADFGERSRVRHAGRNAGRRVGTRGSCESRAETIAWRGSLNRRTTYGRDEPPQGTPKVGFISRRSPVQVRKPLLRGIAEDTRFPASFCTPSFESNRGSNVQPEAANGSGMHAGGTRFTPRSPRRPRPFLLRNGGLTSASREPTVGPDSHGFSRTNPATALSATTSQGGKRQNQSNANPPSARPKSFEEWIAPVQAGS
jgi:hypothetical protein